MDPGEYEASMPTWRATDGRGNPPPGRRPVDDRRRGTVPGFLKFVLFTGILAVLVVVAGLTALRPLTQAFVVSWAWDNPGSMKVDFVADFVRAELGDSLTAKAGSNPDEVVFEVLPGETPTALASRLEADGFITSERAFLFTAIRDDLASKLQAGMFILRRDMTPAEVVTALVEARVIIETIAVNFREGLRLEQMTAKLQITESNVDPQAFYDLVKAPPAQLLADFPWLASLGRPEGASLEGYLYPATYDLVTATNGGPFEVTDAEGLVRMMLERFHTAVGDARLAVPAERGLTFHQVLSLASIVEREAVLDEERALIAGVYQNRLAGLGGTHQILNADPTVVYAWDTIRLGERPFAEWRDYFFWDTASIGAPLASVQVPEALQGYQTYQVAGLIPGPICTPAVPSIDAALLPDTAEGYAYFLAIPDGGGTHVFAKTLEEHNANRAKYGY